jgi:NADH-quinone oxidoreductase subunit E
MSSAFSEETRAQLDALRNQFPDARSVIIPALKAAQREFGHLNEQALDAVGAYLDLPRPVVAGVATFYHNFHLQPRGRHIIGICRTLSCELAGAAEVSRRLQELAGVRPGETSADGLLTLREVECLACCGTAPAVQIDFDYYEGFSADRWPQVLEDLRAGRKPEGGAGIPGGPITAGTNSTPPRPPVPPADNKGTTS